MQHFLRSMRRTRRPIGWASAAICGVLLATWSYAGILPDDQFTQTAITSGNWFDQGTWDDNTVPGSDARVSVPAGIQVSYAGVSDTRLHSIQVDGNLRFDPQADSRMILDTLVVGNTGLLEAGTVASPVTGSVEIIIAANGNIDVTEDPLLLSRGIVVEGAARMHGTRKTVHGKVAADPMAGQQTITMAQAPDNWRVGDTIVLTGTRYSGWKWDNDIQQVRYHGTQDEVRTITAINGTEVSIDQALEFDHLSPRSDLKASVANYSRNITVRSENGPSLPVHQRGHVMFRHTDDVDVRYAAFWHLGRTDKSVPSFETADITNVEFDSNVRGRYSFHFHRAGADNMENPGIAVGNAVFTSPGWGYVHHDSNAIFHNNASYDTFGAGFVAETANEIGAWTNNIAIRAEGNSAFNPKNGNQREEFDMGRTGDGFWFQGRLVRSVGNVAASVNHGYVYLHRGTGMLGFPADVFMLPEALRLDQNSTPDDAPIFNFHDNEAFASTVGIYVVKANPNQQHDIHSHLSEFTAWEVQAGAAMEYTSHYLLEDFDLIALTPEAFRSPAFGIEFGTNTTDMVINRASVVGFDEGVRLQKDFTDGSPPSVNQYVNIDVSITGATEDYVFYDPSIDQILTSADLTPNQFSVVINGGAPLEYNSPATSAGSGIVYSGTKTDSVGDSPIPAGTDEIATPSFDMIAVVSQDGYYRTAGGAPYAVVEEYFTDRATGRIEKFGLVHSLGPNVEDALGNEFSAWRDAFQRGIIDLASQPPVANDDQVFVGIEGSVIIAPLLNDTDPEGDTLLLDGVVAPRHGSVVQLGDGTLRYEPDFDFEGTDTFRYWASDDNGNFSPASIVVIVGNDMIFADGFGVGE